jgi:uncharacterized membrane protein
MSATPASEPVGRPSVRPLPPEAYTRMTFVLRLGLGISLATLAGGLVVYLLQNPGASSTSVLSGNPTVNYLSFSDLASGLASGSVGAVLTLGLVLLVATPIVRVASGFYFFGKAGERAMTVITFAVLALLLLGVLFIGPLVR